MIYARIIILNAQIRFQQLLDIYFKVGSTVGVMKKANGQLHIFFDGEVKGKFALKISCDVYAVVDLFGKGCCATITGKLDISKSFLKYNIYGCFIKLLLL